MGGFPKAGYFIEGCSVEGLSMRDYPIRVVPEGCYFIRGSSIGGYLGVSKEVILWQVVLWKAFI